MLLFVLQGLCGFLEKSEKAEHKEELVDVYQRLTVLHNGYNNMDIFFPVVFAISINLCWFTLIKKKQLLLQCDSGYYFTETYKRSLTLKWSWRSCNWLEAILIRYRCWACWGSSCIVVFVVLEALSSCKFWCHRNVSQNLFTVYSRLLKSTKTFYSGAAIVRQHQ